MYYVANARMPNEKAHGIQLAKQCEAFIAQGVDLELIVPGQKNEIKDSIEKYYTLAHVLSVKKMLVLNFCSSRLAYNLRCLSFALSSFLYLAWRIRKRAGILYTIDLDQFSFFLLPLLRVPVFFEIHGSKKRNPFLVFFLKRVRGIVTNSRGVATKLQADFMIAKEKIITAPNGIDPALFPSRLSKQEARKELHIPSEKEIAVHTGQFYDWKGLGILAETALLCPEVLLYLVGGTEQAFKRVAGVKNVPSNIIFVGHRPLHEIPVWIAAADIALVLGTKSNTYSYTETSPMKIFEFLACGCPMVVSGTLANREVVSDKEAFFYEPDDAYSLASAMKKALHEKDSSQKAAFGKEKAKEYTWAERTKKIMQFISSRV
ncbi:MAG: group 1 glycosyl transferase [Parcubacteria group bacterium Gr01-1014_48]|nr:MAG: group 1 glycosyl transferase [Parcubacteria group bacterium Greene0416_14]TSC74489.1 MAG: group 1 glycosyl transferase [Parcubacteria group bacterium Gr01-1014_48]TSD00347.1 MAG: group 1 glycosyl transferase [Parcubacteria group bacterium Greene1014_15]TSD07758.1 MAG: group 1 glycosyl transferase [Parcubacteria group bacterium Greene0714_4]